MPSPPRPDRRARPLRHPEAPPRRRPNHSYLRDFIYGAIDGAVTTFAVVSGVAGAGLSSGVIVVLGFANLIADGFSMATPPDTAATKAARAWLELVDAARHAQAWEKTAAELKGLISRKEWESVFLSQRHDLGRLRSRKLAQSLDDPQAAIVTFHSSFEKKKSAAEMLIVTREADGRLRVMGYEIL